MGRFGRWLWRLWCRFQDRMGGWPVPYETPPEPPVGASGEHTPRGQSGVP